VDTSRVVLTKGNHVLKRMLLTLAIVVALVVACCGVADAKPKHRIHFTMSLSATVIHRGDSITATGTVRGAAPGKRIILQANYGHGWKTAAKGRVHNDGTYRIVDHPTTTKPRTYRAHVAGSKHHRAGNSHHLHVVIKKKKKAKSPAAPTMQWYSLYDLTAVDYDDLDTTGSVRINGGYFTKSLYDDWPGSIPDYREYNLSRLCTRMTATVGLDDDESSTGSLGDINILRDTVSAYHKQFGLGQSEAIDLDMTNTLRVRIETTSLVSGKTATGAIGSPQVYCNTSIELGQDN
jgi:hypothetical protein